MKVNKKITQKLENQRGIIKEVIIIGAVIFILAYFNLDPQDLVDKFLNWINSL